MRAPSRLVAVTILAILSALVGCQGPPSAAAPGALGSGVPPLGAAGLFGDAPALRSALVAAPADEAQGDPDVNRGLDAILDGCDVRADVGIVNECTDDQLRTLVEQITLRPAPERVRTLTAALGSPGPRQAAAAVVLAELYAQAAEPLLQALDAPAVEHLLAALEGQDTPQAVQLAPLTTHAALLAGEDTRLRAMVQNHPSQRAQFAAVRRWLVARRLTDFADVAPLSAAVDQARAQLAVEAVLAMIADAPLSDAERQTVCPWARPIATHPGQQVAALAGRLLVQGCVGEDADAAVAMLQDRLERGEFALPLSELAIALCRADGVSPSQALQARACDLVGRVAADRRVHAKLREQARAALVDLPAPAPPDALTP